MPSAQPGNRPGLVRLFPARLDLAEAESSRESYGPSLVRG